MSEIITKKYDLIEIFDVKDGNPNGDPDANNQPRTDHEDGHGIVTDVCLKRKVRNYWQMVMDGKPGYEVFVKDRAILNTIVQNAYDVANNNQTPPAGNVEKRHEFEDNAQNEMCRKYIDVATFGAVMSTGSGVDVTSEDDEDEDPVDEMFDDEPKKKGSKKGSKNGKKAKKLRKVAGRVTGPVQLTFARSVDPILVQSVTITRKAVTREADADNEGTMGVKHIVPYGLYVGYGHISPQLAKKTGFTEDNLKVFFEAMTKMFELDHASARGTMTMRKIIVFEHESQYGDVPEYKLFDRVKIERATDNEVPRNFSDYVVTLDGKPLTYDNVLEVVPAKV